MFVIMEESARENQTLVLLCLNKLRTRIQSSSNCGFDVIIFFKIIFFASSSRFQKIIFLPILCLIDNARRSDAIGRDNKYIRYIGPKISKVDQNFVVSELLVSLLHDTQTNLLMRWKSYSRTPIILRDFLDKNDHSFQCIFDNWSLKSSFVVLALGL